MSVGEEGNGWKSVNGGVTKFVAFSVELKNWGDIARRCPTPRGSFY